MKHKYFLVLVGIICLSFGCVEYNRIDTPKEDELEQYLMMGEIEDSYSEQMSKQTRSEQAIPDSIAIMSVGRPYPQWDSYHYSGNAQVVGVDMDYRSEMSFSSLHFTSDSTYLTVELISKMLAVKDLRSGKVELFISLYIPDDDYVDSYHALDPSRLYNYGSKGDFTGKLLFSTIDGLPVGVDRYESGRYVDGVFMADNRMTIEERDNIFMSIMGGVVLLRQTRTATRTISVIDEIKNAAILIDDVVIFGSKHIYNHGYSKDVCDLLNEYGDIGITNPTSGGGGGGGGGGTDSSGNNSNSGNEDDKSDKLPCDDAVTGKTNPLVEMNTAPPNPANPAGATFGNTRAGGAKFHQGIDFAAEVGTPVYAAHDGVITWPYVIEQPNKQKDGVKWKYPSGYEGDDNKAGNRIYIKFGDNEEGYWHLQAGNPVAINPRTGQVFKPGDTVCKGDIIGYTGMTGNAQQYGVPHLHYGVRGSNTKQWKNPTDYINTTINADYSASTPCDD